MLQGTKYDIYMFYINDLKKQKLYIILNMNLFKTGFADLFKNQYSNALIKDDYFSKVITLL